MHASSRSAIPRGRFLPPRHQKKAVGKPGIVLSASPGMGPSALPCWLRTALNAAIAARSPLRLPGFPTPRRRSLSGSAHARVRRERHPEGSTPSTTTKTKKQTGKLGIVLSGCTGMGPSALPCWLRAPLIPARADALRGGYPRAIPRAQFPPPPPKKSSAKRSFFCFGGGGGN